MPTISKSWPNGTGSVTATYDGSGEGTIQIESDPNNLYENRSMEIKVKTTDGSNIERTVSIVQAAKVRIDISNAVVTAANQTYSGTAKTPTPTVTLNGATIPSSGYDVAYSNNTNAGTATITITGKGDYTGTATGTFTIAKANPTYTAPTARTSLTYSGSSQYLVNAGSTSHGTIQYSSNGTSWSTTRPSSTNAGSYTTYWRLVGDSNHNDVASTSLSTTIAKASRTLSFDDAYAVVAPSGNVTKTATPSAGSGDGAITYSISSTTYATINSSSGKVTAKTSEGSAIVTATIAEGTNYLSATASYNLYVFATIHNFAYTGSVQNIALPPGSYKLQCWGAQGGTSAAIPTYGITAKDGGKGGYSEGVLTIAEQLTLYAFVGGQGGASGNGGWNCGGGSYGSSSYDANNEFGISSMACGGGATDIALTTSSMSYSSKVNNRSNASLLSRMIVAGGGSGGAYAYKRLTSVTTQTKSKSTFPMMNNIISNNVWNSAGNTYWCYLIDVSAYLSNGYTNLQFTVSQEANWAFLKADPVVGQAVQYAGSQTSLYAGSSFNKTIPSDAKWLYLYSGLNKMRVLSDLTFTITSYSYDADAKSGYVGGGVTGDGVSDYYKGKQNEAGVGASFGKGAMALQNYRYCAGSGGGGWYGGGASQSNSYIEYVKYMGGGSGFVNVAASAGNRPSGYTGLQLDSGETKAGNTSFPAPGGGNETGHAGNGYARITRLA